MCRITRAAQMSLSIHFCCWSRSSLRMHEHAHMRCCRVIWLAAAVVATPPRESWSRPRIRWPAFQECEACENWRWRWATWRPWGPPWFPPSRASRPPIFQFSAPCRCRQRDWLANGLNEHGTKSHLSSWVSCDKSCIGGNEKKSKIENSSLFSTRLFCWLRALPPLLSSL